MSEKNQEDSETIEILNRKIDDIQCVIKIVIILIVLIIATQFFHILESSDYPVSNSVSSEILITITAVFFILAAISFICTSSSQRSRA
ncbi:MAG: hypothetical protein E4H14_07200 [Candidatus Thorarchaeota archaeon]|nr:MAG: hypothetical protein E4H14_07200 [Candidatus Thorarchaeota archaeon]